MKSKTDIFPTFADSFSWSSCLQQGIRFGIAIALLAPIPMYMIYYTVQQMPGALAHNQIIGDSISVVVVGIVVAFLSRNNATR